MEIEKDLKAIFEGEIPVRRMLVRTVLNAKDVELYGINQRGFKIPLDKVEEFIGDLEQKCTNPRILYHFESGEAFVEIPGVKVNKTVQYLRQARDIGITLAKYQMIF